MWGQWASVLRRAHATADNGSSGGGTAIAPEAHSVATAEALHRMVEEHSDAVYRVAYSIVRDATLAEDIAQESLIKAWQALPRFRGDAPLKNWLLRITHNTALSALRSRREEARDPNLLPETETRLTVEKKVEDLISVEEFQAALDQLDETSRSIVVFREVEGMSYDEICEVLELPLPTVKTRLLRARRTLANALKDWRP
ncbi:MAG: RNA polymerase sigma factor [Actinomycetia bacterium]|nr:RNA polymerase sigma factor [Actinomycetes bacterium]MCP4084995.1 RNA polymerase sigma factor [Actinomycetes bacterium]